MTAVRTALETFFAQYDSSDSQGNGILERLARKKYFSELLDDLTKPGALDLSPQGDLHCIFQIIDDNYTPVPIEIINLFKNFTNQALLPQELCIMQKLEGTFIDLDTHGFTFEILNESLVKDCYTSAEIEKANFIFIACYAKLLNIDEDRVRNNYLDNIKHLDFNFIKEIFASAEVTYPGESVEVEVEVDSIFPSTP